ncbi:MAG: PEGA domain-containing protein [Gemmatimonadetes bacterium]|nr:PEGA domain-containing protein [Gemmatimonadota bacterium]
MAVAGFLFGCATAWFLQFEEVNILSDPPGARIEMNDEYVGRTPLTIRYRRGGAGGQANQLIIRASARNPESCSETRVISRDERTPGVVYFELGACAVRAR